jgi:hypothetical protein
MVRSMEDANCITRDGGWDSVIYGGGVAVDARHYLRAPTGRASAPLTTILSAYERGPK